MAQSEELLPGIRRADFSPRGALAPLSSQRSSAKSQCQTLLALRINPQIAASNLGTSHRTWVTHEPADHTGMMKVPDHGKAFD